MNATVPPNYDDQRLNEAAQLIEQAVHSGTHPSAVVAIAECQRTLWTHVVPGQDDG